LDYKNKLPDNQINNTTKIYYYYYYPISNQNHIKPTKKFQQICKNTREELTPIDYSSNYAREEKQNKGASLITHHQK
jgi:hypothetical protein